MSAARRECASPYHLGLGLREQCSGKSDVRSTEDSMEVLVEQFLALSKISASCMFLQ